jgi:hypothetical protein
MLASKIIMTIPPSLLQSNLNHVASLPLMSRPEIMSALSSLPSSIATFARPPVPRLKISCSFLARVISSLQAVTFRKTSTDSARRAIWSSSTLAVRSFNFCCRERGRLSIGINSVRFASRSWEAWWGSAFDRESDCSDTWAD